MKTENDNEAPRKSATDVCVDRARWNPAVVGDPASAHRKVRRAGHYPMLPLCASAAVDAPPTAAVHSNDSGTTIHSHPATARTHWLARDASSSDLVNFPFAFTVFVIWGTGTIAIGWGMTLASVWLTVMGFLASLVGGVLHGWSLRSD